MKRLNTFNFFFLIFYFSLVSSNQGNNSIHRLQPENFVSVKSQKHKKIVAKNAVVVSANKYATNAAWNILKSGGNAADATVTLQLILGLVEPQSSGIGGGSFLTYYNNKYNSVVAYEGREKAPLDANENLFLNNKGKKLSFFDAVIGGLSVGVPGTLDLLFKFHEDHGKLSWKEVIQPAIKLSKFGFVPPQRLKRALSKEKFLLKENVDNSYFLDISRKPRSLVRNFEYANTLELISQDFRIFYEGEIAKNIVKKVNEHKTNPGLLKLKDLVDYQSSKSDGLCKELKTFILCGPNLPSSGGIAIIQALMVYENFSFQNSKNEFEKIFKILDFIYFLRKEYLADNAFENVNLKKLLNIDFLLQEFEKFLLLKSYKSSNYDKNEFNSTSHFSILDFDGNVVSMTSSIENSFGSRQFVDGFLLNNQLTDFNFEPFKKKKIKNRVEGGKKPLSSMSPIIILDKERNFILSVGSPGGTAIISYVFKTIIDVMYLNISPDESIKNGNFVSKDGRIFIEKGVFDKKKIRLNIENVIERNLISGIAIIKKENKSFRAVADPRRDGSVRGE